MKKINFALLNAQLSRTELRSIQGGSGSYGTCEYHATCSSSCKEYGVPLGGSPTQPRWFCSNCCIA